MRFLRHSSITWKILAYNQLLLLLSQFILLRMWPLSKKIHKTWLGRTAMSNLSLFSRLQGNMVDFYSDEQLYLFNRFTVQKLKKKISVGHHVHFLWSPSTDTMLSLCYVHLLCKAPPQNFFLNKSIWDSPTYEYPWQLTVWQPTQIVLSIPVCTFAVYFVHQNNMPCKKKQHSFHTALHFYNVFF